VGDAVGNAVGASVMGGSSDMLIRHAHGHARAH
jgi:hypothetical protein